MRRTPFICASLAALAVPAVALAVSAAAGDGTLVVTNGSAARGTPVVTLVIHGAVIGHVSQGTIIIDDPTPNDGSPEVTNATSHKDVTDTTQKWGGLDLRFRAVGGSYRITIYGTGVDLVASGHGNVVLAGSSDLPTHDGTYSLNGADPRSLPATPSKPLPVGVPTSPAG